ncbi:MAG: flagellar export chaperone FliS [Nitrospiraceae bacterium]
MRSAVQQYQQTNVMTSSGVQVVVVLYDGAIQAMLLAQESIRGNRPADRARFLSRAVNIVTELSDVLDMQQGEDIAVSLRRLYDYILAELLHVNLHHQAHRLDGPVRCLSILREAWQKLAESGAAIHARTE